MTTQTLSAETSKSCKITHDGKTIDITLDRTYQYFDELSEDAYDTLKDDIEARGIQVPIEVDTEGHILDGHHRFKIALELALPPEKIPCKVREDLTQENAKVEHVIKTNLLRRQGTSPIKWVKCAKKIMEVRGIRRGQRHNRFTADRANTVSALYADLGLSDQTARRYFSLYDKLEQEPDLLEAVDTGKMTATKACAEVDKRADKQPKKQKLSDEKFDKFVERMAEQLRKMADKTAEACKDFPEYGVHVHIDPEDRYGKSWIMFKMGNVPDVPISSKSGRKAQS